MTGASARALVVAPFDDALHAHSAQRRRALERLGFRVTACDLTRPPRWPARLLRRDTPARLAHALARAEPSLVLVVGEAGLDRPLLEAAREQAPGPWVHWVTEDLRGAPAALARAPAYDAVFAAGSDVARYLTGGLGRGGRGGGGRDVPVLPHAADPSVYRPHRSRDQYRANVVFAGTATPRREVLLAGLVEFGLALWGPGWRDTALRDYCRGEGLGTDEYVRAYNGATVAVNIHHAPAPPLPAVAGAERATGCNQRVFELAAMGVPQVVDARDDLTEYFRPGHDLLVYRSAHELRDLVRELVNAPDRAQALGANARRTALERHTYMHRMTRLLELLGRSAPAAS